MRPHAVGNVAVCGLGQKCWTSPLHSDKDPCSLRQTWIAQPTESSPMCACKHARMCPSPGAICAHRLEIDCAVSILCSNRRRRRRENHRRAKRDCVKGTLHVASPFSLMTRTGLLLKISQLSSYCSTDLASMNPMGLEVGDRRNRAARSRFLATKKRADLTPRSSRKRTYTVTWSARPSIKTGAAHEPWRRVDGFHLNGLRR